MSTVNYRVKSLEELKAIRGALDANGWVGQDGGLQNSVLLVNYPYIQLNETGRTYGFNTSKYHSDMSLSAVFELSMSTPKIERDFDLSVIKGDYRTARINFSDRTVQVGCCVYPFYTIEDLVGEIKKGR